MVRSVGSDGRIEKVSDRRVTIWDEINLLIWEERGELERAGYTEGPGCDAITEFVGWDEKIIGARVFACDIDGNYAYRDVFYPEDWKERASALKKNRA